MRTTDARGERSRDRATRARQLDALLSRYFLEVDLQDRLPPLRQLARSTGASLGSVQAAVARLEERRVIEVERRGHRGSFLMSRDLGRLWAETERTPFVIALPPSHTRRYDGLATGLKRQLLAAGVETFLIFLAGSRDRLRGLQQGLCSAIVMSVLAADELCGESESVLLAMPPGSYVAEHRLFTRRAAQASSAPRRVIIDEHSVDQQILTELQFAGSTVEFVPANYLQFRRLLEEAAADAAVWSADEVPSSLASTLTSRPLSPHVRRRIGERDTRACLVGQRESGSAATLVNDAIDLPELTQIQADVIAGDLIPEY